MSVSCEFTGLESVSLSDMVQRVRDELPTEAELVYSIHDAETAPRVERGAGLGQRREYERWYYLAQDYNVLIAIEPRMPRLSRRYTVSLVSDYIENSENDKLRLAQLSEDCS